MTEKGSFLLKFWLLEIQILCWPCEGDWTIEKGSSDSQVMGELLESILFIYDNS